MTTLGQRHNNPLNVKGNPDDPWKGSSGFDERGHAIFSSLEWGVRAAVHVLAAKWGNGKNTLRMIIADWAPADDTVGSVAGAEANDPLEYARAVSQFMETGVDKPLRLFNSGGAGVGGAKGRAVNDYDQMIQLLLGMSSFENGHWMPGMGDLLRGLARYQEVDVEGRG